MTGARLAAASSRDEWQQPLDIWRAARRGDLGALRALLEPEAEVPVDACDDWGVTPLMCAALHGKEDACALLLNAGASLEKQDHESGYTALHRAFLRCELNVRNRPPTQQTPHARDPPRNRPQRNRPQRNRPPTRRPPTQQSPAQPTPSATDALRN